MSRSEKLNNNHSFEYYLNQDEFISCLFHKEKEAYKKILGTEVEIKKPPSFITPELKQKLETNNLGLFYVPKLDLRKEKFLELIGHPNYNEWWHNTIDEGSILKCRTADYLYKLQEKYPNWMPIGKYPIGFYGGDEYKKKLTDHNLSRNLEIDFWRDIAKGEIDFPEFPGQWIAVETVGKPDFDRELYERTWRQVENPYPHSEFIKKLGFSDYRFGYPINEVKIIINEKEKQNKTLEEFGLTEKQADIRLLEASEWNLLGNRLGWGRTKSAEWTNTMRISPPPSKREIIKLAGTLFIEKVSPHNIIVGDCRKGGAGAYYTKYFYFDSRPSSIADVGFRLAMVFKQ